jgi:hypothetical protein
MAQLVLNHDLPCAQCAYNLRGLQRNQHCPECGYPIADSIGTYIRLSAASNVGGLNGFDKLCAVLAALLAVVFLLLGALGLFIGCSANFTLPPVLGLFPALIGWGILRSVRVAWRAKRGIGDATVGIQPQASRNLSAYRDPIPRTTADIDSELDRQEQPRKPDLPE